MIRYILNKVFGRKENVLLLKLSKLLKNSSLVRVEEVIGFYLIGGFVYEEELYQKVWNKIKSGEILPRDIGNTLKRDLNKDQVEFYLLDLGNEHIILSVFDPYDYHLEEKILDLYRYEDTKINFEEFEELS